MSIADARRRASATARPRRSSPTTASASSRWSGALEAYGPVLAGAEGMNGAQILDACRAAADLPQALAAIDLALWDRAGRRAGQARRRPARRTARAPMWPVNATLTALDRAGAAEQAAQAVRTGTRA